MRDIGVMKKIFLPSIIIAVIFFMWQFISWAAGNFHGQAQKYTPHQDTIQTLLNGLELENGRYLIPSATPELPLEEQNAQWESFMGKPWMFVTYYGPHEMSMAVNMLRGFFADWLFALFFAYLLFKLGPISLKESIGICIGIGMIGFLAISYTNHIWYPTFDLIPTMLDSIVPFTLVGLLNALRWNRLKN